MDLYNWTSEIIITLLKHGWSLTTIGIALAALLRVNGIRKIILRRLPKRFRTEDRLERIERKIDALSAHMEVPEWSEPGALKISRTGPMSLRMSLHSSQEATFTNLGRKTMEKLKNINKALLIPILATVATLIKELYGFEIDDQYLDVGATVIIWSIGFIGLLMHPKKKSEDSLTKEELYYH